MYDWIVDSISKKGDKCFAVYVLLLGFFFSSYFASEALVFNSGLLAITHFWCTYWKLSCTSIDHSGAISLVWTTHGFYPYFKGFFMLNKLCLLCAIDFCFCSIFLLILLISSCK